MKRSTFLRLSALGAAGLSIPFLNGCGKPFNKAMARPIYLPYIFDAKTMKETGQAYIKLVPAENTKGKLIDALGENMTITASTDPAALSSYFEVRTRGDFVTGKTVVVNGWILSQTEARQCALLSLIQQ